MSRRKKISGVHAHLTFAHCVARAITLRELAEDAQLAEGALDDDSLRPVVAVILGESTPFHKAVTLYQLHLMQVELCMEAWYRFHFKDATVETLLSETERLAEFKEARDRVLHPAPMVESLEAFTRSDDTAEWGESVVDAMRAFSRRWFEETAKFDLSNPRGRLESMLGKG